jgi:hypothetical protein
MILKKISIVYGTRFGSMKTISQEVEHVFAGFIRKISDALSVGGPGRIAFRHS